MSDKLNVSALLYKGKLFQIGDLVNCEIGYLDTISGRGFNSYKTGGTLIKINVKIDTIVNSSYLNHGFTYSFIEDLGYTFEFDNGETQYAFESDLAAFPQLISERVKSLNKYYSHPINKDKADNLRRYFKLDSAKNLGTYLKNTRKMCLNIFAAPLE